MGPAFLPPSVSIESLGAWEALLSSMSSIQHVLWITRSIVRLMLNMSLSREQWLAAAQTVFTSLDAQSNGLTMDRLMCVLREKLPAAEVEYAVEDALVDAGYKGIP